ncbi:MAG: hypothetical protein EXR75_04420 [Myxococcales bacterium]|nr:hypothetical protein [Myxococcales bacterium]
MKTPDAAALKKRARAMLLAMTEREHWIYALVRDEGTFDKALLVLQHAGVPRAESAAGGSVVRFGTEESGASFVVYDAAPLGVVLLEGSGAGAPEALGKVLEATGFLPQSELWRRALDVGDAAFASRAVRTLAHMMVAWDADFHDLFILHLASPDAIARHEATVAITLASLVARDAEPGLELLEEGLEREPFPKLCETMREAMEVLRAYAGKPVDLSILPLGKKTPTS